MFAGQIGKAEGSSRNILNIFGKYNDALDKHCKLQDEIKTATSQVLMNKGNGNINATRQVILIFQINSFLECKEVTDCSILTS